MFSLGDLGEVFVFEVVLGFFRFNSSRKQNQGGESIRMFLNVAVPQNLLICVWKGEYSLQ